MTTWRRGADALVQVAVVGLAAALVLAQLPLWPCTLLLHFTLQLWVISAVVAASTFALRRHRYADLSLMTTLLLAFPLIADLSRSPQPIPVDGLPVRVLLLNVHTRGDSFAEVRALIVDEQPDVIGLLEIDQRWLDALAPALTSYPGRIESPRSDNFGIALYARGRVIGAAEALGSEVPTVVAKVEVANTSLAMVLTHPIPPVSSGASNMGNSQLAAVAGRARALTGNVILLGDFNATPWSHAFLRLVAASGLCDSRAGFGLQRTFPASSALLRLPIDHVLTSCTIGIRNRRVGRDVGSDHLPVIVDLVVPRE